MELPGGRTLVVLASLALMAAGAWLVVQGLRRKFEKHLDLSSMARTLCRVATTVGLLGHVARGVVVGLAGLLLVKAALDDDPQEAKRGGTPRHYRRAALREGPAPPRRRRPGRLRPSSFVEARYRRL